MLKEILQQKPLDEIKAYTAGDPVMMRGKDEDGSPYSYHLVRRGDLDAARWLTEYSRADMNETDRKGRNILFPVIESGSLSLCRYFCERVGIDPLQPDRFLKTPLEYAAERGEEEILAYLEERCGLKLAESYKNPVRRGFSPDPSVVRVGDDYYMVNSSFLCFPALPISRSKDLVHWKTIGHAVSFDNPVDLRGFDEGRGFWAPDISWHEGRFYVIATLRYNDDQLPMRRQMVVSAEDPRGPWSAPHFLEEDGIDPSVFRDQGRTFVLLNRGARIFETDEKLSRKISDTKLLYYGDLRKSTEAPHLIKHQGYYYLFLAEGGTGQGHRINVARAESLEGPYTPCPYNPLLTMAGKSGCFQRTGHGKPFRTKSGEWYICYLGARQYEEGFSALGRETFLDKIEWTKDGWPLINGRRGPSALAPLPLPPVPQEREEGFGTDRLSEDAYFIRYADKEDFSVEDGTVTLRASACWPDDPAAGPILLKRQEEAFCEITLEISLSDLTEGSAAGLIFYYDENSWYFQALKKRENKIFAELWKNAGRGRELLAEKPLAVPDDIRLKAEVSWPEYRFIWPSGKNHETAFEYAETSRHLTDEGLDIGKRFTGAGAGAFLVGSGKVRFRNFRQRALL